MNNSNYNEIFKNITQISGNDLSKFEQYALLIHAIFLKNNFIYKDNKILENDWNKEYDKAEFEYNFTRGNEVKIKLELRKDPNDAEKVLIKINGSCVANNNNKIDINSAIDLRDGMITKIDFENLEATIHDLEKFIRETFFKEIVRTGEIQRNNNDNNNNNFGVNVSGEDYHYGYGYGGEVDPNRLLNNPINQGGYNNPDYNPYFTTGGGSVGGSLVGPNSDIFAGHMFPQPQSGIHPPIRYDPIGPFGTFGGPQQKPKDVKKTDPLFGGNPFGGDLPGNIKKGPFGGGIGGGFGGDFGGLP